MPFEVRYENGNAKITTPYNPEFVERIKNAGGKWSSHERVWVVDEENIEYAREIMRDVYGRTDLPPIDMVDVKITFQYESGETCKPYTIMGKVLSAAKGRDSGASPGEDVVFLKGKPISAGSAKNWQSAVEGGSVVVLKNVPRKKALAYDNEYVTVEILEGGSSREKLIEEKIKLEKRLEEINEVLKK